MTPVFSHGDLRLYLLSLLDESPRHGYDIIRALAERTGGTYTPSAGTVYPRLSKLAEEGQVTSSSEGRKTVYVITDAGRAEVAERSGELAGIEARLSDSVRVIADEVRQSVGDAMKSLRADLAEAAQQERAQAPRSGKGRSDDPRVHSRAQLQRAEAAISAFRGRVRGELRSHVARGRSLPAQQIDVLENALDVAAADLSEGLREQR